MYDPKYIQRFRALSNRMKMIRFFVMAGLVPEKSDDARSFILIAIVPIRSSDGGRRRQREIKNASPDLAELQREAVGLGGLNRPSRLFTRVNALIRLVLPCHRHIARVTPPPQGIRRIAGLTDWLRLIGDGIALSV
jgi:hypothetical protein